MHMLMGGVACTESVGTLWSGLTWSVDGSGTKVVISPGWWPDNKTTPTVWRTNQTAASMIFKVSNCTAFGLKLGNQCYSSSAVRPGLLAARKATTELGLFASTTYVTGIKPGNNPQGVWIYTNLDKTQTYYIQVITAMPGDYPTLSGTSPNGFCSFERMRQPALGVNSADGGLGNHYGAFWDVIGVVASPGTTFNNITWANTQKKFLLYSDSNCDGNVSGGTTTYTTAEHRASLLANNDNFASGVWDIRGVTVQWFWTAIQTYCVANNYVPVIMNISGGGAWQGKMGSATRTGHQAWWPGIYADLVDRFKYRTNNSNTDFTVGTDWTSGWTPHGIILGSFYNDRLQATIEATYFSESNFTGGTVKDNVANSTGTPVATMKTIFTQWATAKMFAVVAQCTDAIIGDSKTTLASIAAGIDVGGAAGSYYAFSAPSGTQYLSGLGRYANLYTLVNGVNGFSNTLDLDGSQGTGQPHPNASQHETIRSAIQSTFNALAI